MKFPTLPSFLQVLPPLYDPDPDTEYGSEPHESYNSGSNKNSKPCYKKGTDTATMT
jgi:hypothetical protein